MKRTSRLVRPRIRVAPCALGRVLVRAGVAGLMVVPPALVVGGCSAGGSLGRAEYRREVTAICRATVTAVAKLPSPDPADVARMVATGRRALAIQRDSLRRIQELDAPTADEQQVSAWLDLVGRTLDASAASLRAQARTDLVTAAQANAEGSSLSAQADTIAVKLRVPTCTGSPSP